MPPNFDINANGTPGEAFVTVSDLAIQLEVSLPRLLRLLKRDGFKEHISQQQRRTKTGTRTVTTVSVSVVRQIEAALREGTAPQTEQKQYAGEPYEVLADEDTRVRQLVGMMMQQAEARIAEQAATIADLRQDKNEWKQERLQLLDRVEALALENQELKQITAVAAGEIQNHPDERTGDTESDRNTVPGQVDTPTVEEGAEVVAETVRRVEVAEGLLQAANDTLVREQAARAAAEAELQALRDKQNDVSHPRWMFWKRDG